MGDLMLRERMVSLEEFLEYYDTVSCCIESDSVFCNMATGVWMGRVGVQVRSRQSSHRSGNQSQRSENQSQRSGKDELSQRSRPSGQQQYSRGGDNTSQRSHRTDKDQLSEKGSRYSR